MTPLYAMSAPLLCLLLAMLLGGALALGYQRGAAAARAAGANADDARTGLSALDTVVFGLFGLLLALTLTHAASRADGRRRLVVDEANAIGTAWLRCAVLPAADRQDLEGLLGRYLDERIAHSAAGSDRAAAGAAQARATALQQVMWARAAAIAAAAPSPVHALLLQALNDAFDLQNTRQAEDRARLPDAIVLIVLVTAITTALLTGYALGHSGDAHPLAAAGFLIVTLLVIYVILDLDRPHRGMFQVDGDALIEFRTALPTGTPPVTAPPASRTP